MSANPLVTINWTDRARRIGIAPDRERSSSVKLQTAAILVLDQLAVFTYPTAQTELELSAARQKRGERLAKDDGRGRPVPAYSGDGGRRGVVAGQGHRLH